MRVDSIRAQIEALQLLRENATAKRKTSGDEFFRLTNERSEMERMQQKTLEEADQQIARAERAIELDEAVIVTYDFRISEFKHELADLERSEAGKQAAAAREAEKKARASEAPVEIPEPEVKPKRARPKK